MSTPSPLYTFIQPINDPNQLSVFLNNWVGKPYYSLTYNSTSKLITIYTLESVASSSTNTSLTNALSAYPNPPVPIISPSQTPTGVDNATIVLTGNLISAGMIPVGSGGTGLTSFPANSILLGNGSSPIATDSLFNYSSSLLTVPTVSITATTISTSSTTGSLVVTGGIGTPGNLNIGGSLSVTGTSNFAGSVTVPTPTLGTQAASKAYVDGITYITAGTGLTKSTGTLSVSASQTQITTIGTLTGLTVTGQVLCKATNAATSTGTGSLVVSGGAGFAGSIYAGGNLSVTGGSTFGGNVLSSAGIQITATTVSSSSSTGALTISGGVGISGALNVGGTANFIGTVTVPVPINSTDAATKNYVDSNIVLAGTGLTKTGTTLSVNPSQTQITALGTLSMLSVSGNTSITNTSPSTSTTSGALTVSGGMGLAGSLYVGGTANFGNTVTISSSPVNSTDATNKNYVDSISYITPGFALTKTGGTLAVNSSFITSLGTLTGLSVSGQVAVYNTTAATSITTGSITTAGGMGIVGSLYVGGAANFAGTVTVSTTPVNATDVVNKSYVDSNVSSSAGTGLTKTGTVLSVNASQTQVTTVGTLTGLTVSGITQITNATVSTNTGSGALVVTGGTGIGGSLNVGGNTAITGNFTQNGTQALLGGIVSLTNTAASNSTTSGSLVVSGGVGISGSLNVGSLGSLLGISVTGTADTTGIGTGSFTVSGGASVSKSLYVGTSFMLPNMTQSTSQVASTSFNYIRLRSSDNVYLNTGLTVGNIGATGGYTSRLCLFALGQLDSTNNEALNIDATPSGGVIMWRTVGTGVVRPLNVYNSTTFNVDGTIAQSATVDAVSVGTGSLVLACGIGIGKSLYLGSLFAQIASSQNDGTTLSLGTNSVPFYYHSINAPTLTATNPTVTRTTAATLYVSGAPIQGLNTTITNAYALQIASGRVLISDTTASNSTVSGALVVGGGIGVAGALYGTTANFSGMVTVATTAVNGTDVANKNYVDSTVVTAGTGLSKTGNALSVNALQTQITAVGTLSGLVSSGVVSVTNTSVSTGIGSGALQIAGGAAIAGSVYVGTNISVTGTSTLTGNCSIAGICSITNTTPSTSKITGALVVSGGIGLSGALYGSTASFSGTVTIPATPVNTTDAASKSYVDSLIVTAGTGLTKTGTVFSVNASQTQITTIGTLTALTSSGVISVTNTTASTSALTGALVVSGGAGISGSLYVGGSTVLGGVNASTLIISATTDTTSTTTGALQVAGGIGIGRGIYVGTNITVGYTVANASMITLNGQGAAYGLQIASNGTNFTFTNINAVGNINLVSGSNGSVLLNTNFAVAADGTTDIYNTVDSTSLTTGALQVAGGAAVGKSFYVGSYFTQQPATIVDSTTVASGTNSNSFIYATFNSPTLSATNTGVIRTNATSLYVAAPTAGTNTTIVNSYALYANGNVFAGNALLAAWGSGNWINMSTSGPSGIGAGGVGNNAWLAYASAAGNWFSNSLAGDVCQRNVSGRILFGNTSGLASMALSGDSLGIGTVTPAYKLDVVGDIHLTGTIYNANTVDSTSTTTGSIQTTGGIAAAKTITTGKSIQIMGSTSGAVTVQSPATVTSYTATLPAALPTATSYLQMNTAGVMSYITNPNIIYDAKNLAYRPTAIVWTNNGVSTSGTVTFYPTTTNSATGTALFPTAILSVQAMAVYANTSASTICWCGVKSVSTDRRTIIINVVQGAVGNSLNGSTAVSLTYAPNNTVVYCTIIGY